MPENDPHPWYGPCDAIADGECAECRAVASDPAYGRPRAAWRADYERDSAERYERRVVRKARKVEKENV